ncbi:hypothetical protein NL676_009457 [Syzygium grande]|nr:hypothetical protein NL676_009457 [Syzygium grande]
MRELKNGQTSLVLQPNSAGEKNKQARFHGWERLVQIFKRAGERWSYAPPTNLDQRYQAAAGIVLTSAEDSIEAQFVGEMISALIFWVFVTLSHRPRTSQGFQAARPARGQSTNSSSQHYAGSSNQDANKLTTPNGSTRLRSRADKSRNLYAAPIKTRALGGTGDAGSEVAPRNNQNQRKPKPTLKGGRSRKCGLKAKKAAEENDAVKRARQRARARSSSVPTQRPRPQRAATRFLDQGQAGRVHMPLSRGGQGEKRSAGVSARSMQRLLPGLIHLHKFHGRRPPRHHCGTSLTWQGQGASPSFLCLTSLPSATASESALRTVSIQLTLFLFRLYFQH